MTIEQSQIISDAEIESITGYKTPTKQCQCLKEAGVFYLVRRDGRPVTTWQHFNDPILYRRSNSTESIEPNFEGL